MKTFYLLLIIFLVSANELRAQRVSGSISAVDGEPINGITISLEGTAFKTISTENGDFRFNKIAPGIYNIIATGIGYRATKKSVVVDQNKTIFLELQLDKSSTELQEVLVHVNRVTKKDIASNYSARMPLGYIENPQVTNTVSRQLIKEQAITDFSSILRNMPGVVKGWASTNTYYSSRGFNTRSYFRNGVASYSESELDPANLEQMQAVKGPSGTLFGGALASFGGLFNRITKKPFETTAIEISYQGGSYDLSRVTADINAPLNKEKTVLFRLNAANHFFGSFQDAGFIRSLFIAPSLTYKVSDRLTVSLDAEIYNREATSQQQIAVTGSLDNLTRYSDYKRSYSNNGITLKDPYSALYGKVNYKLSKGWTSQTNLTRSQGQNLGNYLTFSLLKDSLLVRTPTQYPISKDIATQVQQNFIGDFLIGKMRNRLVAGFDYYQLTSNFASNSLGGRGGRPTFDTLNIKRAMPNYGLISSATITNKLINLVPTASSSAQNTYSVYLSDVLNLTGNLSVMASLRLDKFNSCGSYNASTGITTGMYNQASLAPKFGIVYQVVKDRISLFANYMSGFQNTAGTDANNVAFKPQYANQLEGGIKTDIAGELLSATVSYYDIRVKNTLRADVTNTGFSIQDGTQYSKGIEVELSSRPLQGLTITAGFAHNESKLTSADASVSDLRPVNSGPINSGNWWLSYRLPLEKLPGLGLGFGGNYVGTALISNTKAGGEFGTPSYTLLNASLFYDLSRFRISANMDNLTNKYYYTTGFGIVTPGMLRRIVLGLSIKF